MADALDALIVTGSNAGAGTSSAWTKYPIDATMVNTISGASVDLAGDDVTLPAGTYDVDGYACIFKGNSINCRLYDITNTATLLWGGAGYSSDSGNYASGLIPIKGRITLAGAADLRVEYYGAGAIILGNSAPDGSTVAVYLAFREGA